MTTKRRRLYRVANPRGVPEGVPVFTCTCGDDYGEGDRWDAAKHAHANPERLIRLGMLLEVTPGGDTRDG